eukprot:TRINITY_DN447_c0_g1::TRINITY_DN447_c0_g1_i1::g.2504::m.2504 TRINITY_DN447_c0_g1::TRINITY_DN447_c0_g1_i1::g.2504  ORF type:complete len:144 (+),score=24.34,Tmemb_14/PF03647.8/0.0056,DUF4118/PF13493.1/1.7,DUF4118/PF13493.1/25,Myelin_PLP/PF01275.14/3e+02,Myelin_PLP/PF01275.14/3.9e+02,Myelin_PLP/PF01275.14/0.41 TRINITY_DN447_c0_g1_i1:52-432(+)
MNPSKILAFYSAFLFASAFYATAATSFDPRSKTALIVGGGSATVMAVCSYLTRAKSNPDTAANFYRLSMAMSCILAVALCWRAEKLIGNEEKAYLLHLFILMISGSGITLVALLTSSLPHKHKKSQ